MKNWSVAVLAIALAFSLPGCRKKKCEKKCNRDKVETRVDVLSTEKTVFSMDEEFEDEDGSEDLEDIEVTAMLASNEEADQKESNEFAWVDAEESELKVVHFDFDKYNVKADQKEILSYNIEQTKQIIKEAKDAGLNPTIVIEGFTCSSAGTGAYNLALSQSRANTIKDVFVKEGITSENLKVVGRGWEMPVVESGSREEQAPNRRVEFRVIYT